MQEQIDALVMKSCRMPSRSSAIGLAVDRPGRDHVELFSVCRLEHGVEPRALIPALCATNAASS